MSLSVHDARSRTRSKSPGGRIRERSRSRDSRLPSPSPSRLGRSKRSSKVYYDSDSFDDELPLHRDDRNRSRSRNNNKYTDEPHLETYRRSEKEDRYYPSGDDRALTRYLSRTSIDKSDKVRYESGSERDRRLSKSKHLPESDSYTDSEDEDALAYGDTYHRDRIPSRNPSRDKLRGSEKKQYYQPDSEDDSSKYRGSSSKGHTVDDSRSYRAFLDSAESGSHRKTENYRYAELQETLTSKKDGRASRSDLKQSSDWAEVPECERPEFFPPQQQQQRKSESHITSQFPQAPAPPPTPRAASNYAFPDPALFPSNPAHSGAFSQYPSIPISQYAAQQSHHHQQQSQYAQDMPHRAGPAATAYVVPPEQIAQQQRSLTATGTSAPQHQYAAVPQFQYAQPDPNIKYTSKKATATKAKSYTQTAEPQYYEIKPGGAAASQTQTLSVASMAGGFMGVPGAFPDSTRPPASPLLEPYRGTYQSISPMPWPTRPPSSMDEGLSDLEPLDQDSDSQLLHRTRRNKMDKLAQLTGEGNLKSKRSKEGSKFNDASEKRRESTAASTKRVTFYDPTADVKALRLALSHSKVEPKPLLSILPYLSSEELLVLRAEYKNHVKLSGKGINIAKHIKVQVSGNFGKACYATALGRWESEAHWANFWYRSNSLRRELLIEALIGRTNEEMREIKASFSDKRYGDNLEKCMKAELKADKFRVAILLALEERRQPNDAPLDMALIRQDVHELHFALVSRDGGETAMIQIIVVRGDAHLREVLHVYESIYHKNFAKEMIAKSMNLVGEVLAHVLNGALNRPMRDALLLRQAIAESGTGRDRAELLISRLVRMHWEPRHLERVKIEYRRRYNKHVEDDIEDRIIGGSAASKSDWAEFCIELAKSSTFHIANSSYH